MVMKKSSGEYKIAKGREKKYSLLKIPTIVKEFFFLIKKY